MSISQFFDELIEAKNKEEEFQVFVKIMKSGKKDVDAVFREAVSRIESGNFSGSRWSMLALAIGEVLGDNEKADILLKSLIEKESENSAYYNNYGFFLDRQNKHGEALKYYVRAYAIDYKNSGHEYAAKLPAWKTILNIAKWVDELQIWFSELKAILDEPLRNEGGQE